MNKRIQSSELLAKRKRSEQRFFWYGRAALWFSVALLVILLSAITLRGYQGFLQTQIRLPIYFDAELLGVSEVETLADISPSSYNRIVKEAIRKQHPEVTERRDIRQLQALVSNNAGRKLQPLLRADEKLIGQSREEWVVASSYADLFIKGHIKESTPEADRKLSDQQIKWLKELREQGRIRTAFNSTFFTQGDSRTPDSAGFLGAALGSLFTLLVCVALAFPIGVMTAIYLEEYARKTRWVDWIEVNINNLAAVPSIVFGLLGLAVYINVLHLPRSAPLVGGLTLALMILPVIIISTRVALKAVPNSIRDAARALGATRSQVVLHHTLPLSMPGVMTGTILGMARAIGETAPLLMIGMVGFFADLPDGFTAASTVMPVQIYLWGSSAEAGFAEKTAAGIMVLLLLLLALNALAIYIRKRFEVRW